MLKEAVRWNPATRLYHMEIIQHLLLIKLQGVTVEMKGDMRQTARIIGQSALALAR